MDSDIFTYFSRSIGFVTTDLDDIVLDNDDFDEHGPVNFVYDRVIDWHDGFKECKLMAIA